MEKPMRHLALSTCALLALSFAACAASVETPGTAPVSDPSAVTARDLAVEKIADGISTPWGLAFLPGGDMLVTELHGKVWRIAPDGTKTELTVDGSLPVYQRGQGGLMDVVLHPGFSENSLVYFTHTAGSEEGNWTAISRAVLTGDALTAVETIFRVAQTKNGGQHFGSRLLFLPDGTLLATIGDGGNPPTMYAGEFIRNQAQNQDTHFGKVLRLNDDGSVPFDNPFIDRPDASHEIYTLGHRNQQGIAMDVATGRVWATEHGAQGGDELNLIEAGKNYGWPVVSHSEEYGPGGRLVSTHEHLDGFEDPDYVWTPSMAPSGLAFYTGDKHPDWQGDLLAGGLRTNGLESRDGALFRLDLNEAGKVIGEERLMLGAVRVRDVRQGPDGHIYVLTNTKNNPRDPESKGGVLWRVLPSPQG
jgi:aldose sugar dehydrogenase